MIDLDSLLTEISADSPCGEDMEYDSAFGELERSAESKGEQQFGDNIIPAEEPDWREVKSNSVALFSRTKDLRVARFLTEALLHLEGISGLRDGLALINSLVEKYWDHVYPQLDPDDDNDPTIRVNIIASLGDAKSIVMPVRSAPLVDSRAMGRFSLRDFDIATGNQPASERSGEESPDLATIDGAFLDAPLEDLQTTANAISGAIEHLNLIDSMMGEKVGVGEAPDLSDLNDALQHCQRAVKPRLEQRVVSQAPVDEIAGDEEAAMGETETAAPASGRSTAALSGEVNSREEALRAMDKICDYFERHEPSSPVPFLIRRAKRLVTKDFLALLRDLAPDGVSQMEIISGSETDESDGY